MSVCLCVRTDGRREYIQPTIASAEEKLHGDITTKIIHDDSGDPKYQAWLWDQFGPLGYSVIHTDARSGFGAAYNHAWNYLTMNVKEPWIFNLEDDFLFQKDIYLDGMIRVMNEHPYIIQMALRRQPWNDVEEAAGGVVECNPEAYEEKRLNVFSESNRMYIAWLEHRLFWTTNPSLFRRQLCEGGFSTEVLAEGLMTFKFLTDDEKRFAYWGGRESGVWVEHIGVERAGTVY